MRAVIQRVSEASVTIGDRIKSKIGMGLLILLGVTWSLYGLVVAVILLLASASQNAWFLLMLERS